MNYQNLKTYVRAGLRGLLLVGAALAGLWARGLFTRSDRESLYASPANALYTLFILLGLAVGGSCLVLWTFHLPAAGKERRESPPENCDPALFASVIWGRPRPDLLGLSVIPCIKEGLAAFKARAGGGGVVFDITSRGEPPGEAPAYRDKLFSGFCDIPALGFFANGVLKSFTDCLERERLVNVRTSIYLRAGGYLLLIFLHACFAFTGYEGETGFSNLPASLFLVLPAAPATDLLAAAGYRGGPAFRTALAELAALYVIYSAGSFAPAFACLLMLLTDIAVATAFGGAVCLGERGKKVIGEYLAYARFLERPGKDIRPCGAGEYLERLGYATALGKTGPVRRRMRKAGVRFPEWFSAGPGVSPEDIVIPVDVFCGALAPLLRKQAQNIRPGQ